MKQLVYFLIVGLAVTALQASTVAAQQVDPNMPPPVPADPMGTAVPPMGDPNIPPTAAPGGPPVGDANMPPAGQ